MMYDWYGHGAGWEGWLMAMFMIVFVVAIVIAVVFLVRYLGQPHATVQAPPRQETASPTAPVAAAPPAAESPQDIVKRRYASGEIEREEYLQKLGDL